MDKDRIVMVGVIDVAVSGAGLYCGGHVLVSPRKESQIKPP